MRKLILAIVILSFAVLSISCARNSLTTTPVSIVGKWQVTSQWVPDNGWSTVDNPTYFEFKSDGTLIKTEGNDTITGTYELKGSELTITLNNSNSTFNVVLKNDTLEISNQNLGYKMQKTQ
ncbi:MAG: lipocalin family protein [Caldisericum exile]